MNNSLKIVHNRKYKLRRCIQMMFLLGLIVGGIIGVTVMAMFQINRTE